MSTEIEKIREKILGLRNSVPSNKKCADCDNPGTIYVDIKFGCFLCARCAGLHRKLSTDISRIKSIYFDTLRHEDYQFIKSIGGNNKFNKKFENKRSDFYPKISTSSSDTCAYEYVKMKYAEKLFYDDTYVVPKPKKIVTSPQPDIQKKNIVSVDIFDDLLSMDVYLKETPKIVDDLSQIFEIKNESNNHFDQNICVVPVVEVLKPPPKKTYDEIKQDILKLYNNS
jgi:hypothetical protein